ncbi:glycosyltransferase family 4 protein [Butyrivibrio sp. INlla14]|uniref:glycosyltransferase family 4 protein n=1 Tax=Butyrivibrio sp. INlla14 TaxID=1520808 RepID=UPI00087603EC|nr:glycosyltransferase family 4 protein [Butyrivibrio sp. INlla14]SCY70258.1 Glycosyltransferase involved in cell wall bisynthesis [Butyrivibrio sp. INlla14]
MKVLYVLHRYHTNMLFIMKGWVDNGHEVKVLTQSEGLIEEHEYVQPQMLGFSKVFKAWHKFYSGVIKRNDPTAYDIFIRYGFPPASKFKKYVDEFKPDLIILRERSLYTMSCYRYCKRKHIPTILYNLSPVYAEPSYFKNDFAHKLVKKLTPLDRITPVHQIGIDMEGKIRDEHAFYAPFVVEPKLSFEKKRYFKDDKINLFEIGKYQDRKNHYMMVNVLDRLRKLYPNVRLTIAGEISSRFEQEYYDNLVKYIDEKGLKEYITLFYNIPKSKIEEIYKDSDLYILTSTGEPASITVIESLAFCVPSISGTDNGSADYVIPGVTGEVFEDCDEDDLFKKVSCIIEDKDTIPRMGKAGYEHICKNFSFDVYYKGVQEAVASVSKK